MSNKKYRSSSQYETVLAIVIGTLAIYMIFDIAWMVYVSLSLGLGALLVGQLAYWIEWLWLKLTRFIGNIVSTVILGIIFYVFLFPIAFIYRLTNRDKLFSKNKTSMFIERNHQFESKDLENPW